MPLYIIFAWLASFLFGVEAIIAKLTSKYSIANAWLFNFLWSLIGLILLMPLALVNNVTFPEKWGNILIAALLAGIFSTLYTFSIYKLDVSVFSPLFNFRTAFSVLFGIALLGEILSFDQIILVIIIFFGGFFVSLDEKFSPKSFFKKSIAIAVGGMIVLSLYGVYIKKAIAETGYWNTTLWVTALTLVPLIFTIPFFHKDIGKIKTKQLSALILISFLGLIGTLSANKAYAANVGISSTIISLPFSMVMAFLFSVFAPKLLEKHTLKVYVIRFIAAAVMFIAALKLSS